MGAAGTMLERIVPPDYADEISLLAGHNRPGPREVSNAVSAQAETRPNTAGYTDFLWQWGQFVDHDIDLTDGSDPVEPADISIPAGDAWFDPAVPAQSRCHLTVRSMMQKQATMPAIHVNR